MIAYQWVFGQEASKSVLFLLFFLHGIDNFGIPSSSHCLALLGMSGLSRGRLLRHALQSRHSQLNRKPQAFARVALSPTRTFCDAKDSPVPTDERSGPKSGILGRILSPNSSGENRLLRALGYYSSESRAIGVGNSLYKQALSRSEAATMAEAEDTSDFSSRFEMLSVHIYLTLRRLRAEKGSPYESEVKTVMQCLFDVFWTDVRSRMMIKEHELTLIVSAKWIKECEQRFFGMALAFDEAWDDENEMKNSISRNISCLKEDDRKVDRFYKYMTRERQRLDKTTIEQVWDGMCWDGKYNAVQSA